MKKSKISLIILIFLLSAVIVLCGVKIHSELSARNREKQNFDEIVSLVTVDENDDSESEDQPSAESQTEKKRNLKELLKQNSDCIGWIYIPGTAVNYPVMHTPANPQKYLRRDFYGNYSQSGVPFLDARCDLESTNLIIYGHNMRNGTMFSELKNYVNADFRKAHSIIEFEIADRVHRFIVTKVKITDAADKIYNEIYSSDGRFLTLSTCYGNRKSDRILVTAKEEIQ